MLELQTQIPQTPEPIFPDLVPLEMPLPEAYDPDNPDNSGTFPTGEDVKQEASAPNGLERYFALQSLLNDTTGLILSGGGQGKAPKPVTKIRGTQTTQKQEKKLPKLIIRNPFLNNPFIKKK